MGSGCADPLIVFFLVVSRCQTIALRNYIWTGLNTHSCRMVIVHCSKQLDRPLPYTRGSYLLCRPTTSKADASIMAVQAELSRRWLVSFVAVRQRAAEEQCDKMASDMEVLT
jgi:hypothetical protein